MSLSFRLSIVSSVLALGAVPTSIDGSGLQSQDLYRFRSVSDVEFSPDGRRIAYAGQHDIVDAPDDIVLAKAILALTSQGNITTETCHAFTEQEYRTIIGGLA
jgi:roadblock/LC7 domain-containing protein